ncbi:hypothetical protein Tsubulata_006153 [Turnera subulata]|uniref:Uncharacterized protein n=1 Tax=Turnera subulata TaxID=218843 RepID=A0A9Q0FQJ0_9ROSI|nr:hypothetical protein Tsubulata_006153 [Turnera subulata]
MGICLARYRERCTGSSFRILAAGKKDRVLQVVKTDGKILEFRAPILVKDILLYFSGSGIGMSKEALDKHLPPNYELKLGETYYILPSLSAVVKTTASTVCQAKADRGETKGVKRIKVVITKQELQQLLEKQVSVEEILLGVGKTSSTASLDSPKIWKPKLESIPEGYE